MKARIVDFSGVAGVPEFPATIHVTEIKIDAALHYHKTITETRYFLECEPGAAMELDGETAPVKPGIRVLTPPRVRHRAIGRMKILLVATPKFDPAGEWLD